METWGVCLTWLDSNRHPFKTDSFVILVFCIMYLSYDSFKYFFIVKILQKDVFVVSCDLITDVALHHLADIHRSHDSTLTAFLAPVPQTSADREAANNPKTKKKTDTSGIYLLPNMCFGGEVKH